MLREETIFHFSQDRASQGSEEPGLWGLLAPPPGTPEPPELGRVHPVLLTEDKLWLKPYVDLQAYEDPAQGALDFTQELDPAWLVVDTVIGEGEPRGLLCVATQSCQQAPSFRPFCVEPSWPLLCPRSSQMSLLPVVPCVLKPPCSRCNPLIGCPGAAPTSCTICLCDDGISDKEQWTHHLYQETGSLCPGSGSSQRVPKRGRDSGRPAFHPTRGPVSLGCPDPLGHQGKWI